MKRLLDSTFLSAIAVIIALSLAGGHAVAQSKKERKKAQDLAQEAARAFNQKNYRLAVSKSAESIAIVPNVAEVHFWKGYAHYNLGELDQAIIELDIAQSQGFKPLEVYKIRSLAKYQKKDYDGALADFREGLKLDPNNEMFLVGSGEILSARGNSQEALAMYQHALAQDPKNPDLYFSVANTQAKLGNVEAQTAAAEEAIKRNTRFLGDAYYLAADGYFRQRKFDQAEQAYSSAIDRWKAANEKKPEMRVAYRVLGDIYRRGNRFNDAIRISKQALLDFPNDGEIYTDISWYYSLADRHKDAIDAAQAAIHFLPNEHLAYTNLCRAYNDLGTEKKDAAQYQLAINACNAALKLSPNDGETYFYLGRSYDLQGKSADATRYYERAVKGLEAFTKDNPDYSDGFYLLGNAYFADGQYDKAIGAYRKCLELSPRFVKARYNLGIIYTINKNKSAAMEQYNSLLALDQTLAAKLKTEIDKL
jgi:tetratricopeptide (TPR) repeat protein